MSWIDIAQLMIAFVALFLQVLATYLAKPLKPVVPRKLWNVIMALNFCVLTRRILSIAEVVFGWQTQTYHTTTVLVGLGVSIFMLLTITTLRSHVTSEKKRIFDLDKDVNAISRATLDFAAELKEENRTKIENSAAYRLAVLFNSQRDTLEAAKNGK